MLTWPDVVQFAEIGLNGGDSVLPAARPALFLAREWVVVDTNGCVIQTFADITNVLVVLQHVFKKCS
jgi:hypothetical protein